MSKPSVVFLGTGPVSAESLKLILDSFEVEAVITKPKPDNHKEDFPLTEFATREKLKIYEVKSKEELSELFKTKTFTSRVGLVIDFGIIMNKDILEYFPLGMINSHFSLLPEWRGADPITFSLLSGQKETGVSLMKVVQRMDEGPIIAQEKYSIKEKLTISELTSDLVELSAEMLKKYLPNYIEGKIEPKPQAAEGASYSKKLTKADGEIDLTKPAVQLECEVRAYLGWPGSKLKLRLKDNKELELTVLEAEVVTENDDSPLTLKTSKDYLKITKLKLPGKNKISSRDFLNGYRSKL